MPVTPNIVRNYVTNTILGAVSTVTVSISLALVKVGADKRPAINDLTCYLIIGLVAAVLLFACGALAVFRAVKKLRDAYSGLHKVVFIVAGVLVAAAGVAVAYAAFLAFSLPIPSSAAGLISAASGDNIFEAKDPHMMAVFFLNILSFGVLLSAGVVLARRGTK